MMPAAAAPPLTQLCLCRAPALAIGNNSLYALKAFKSGEVLRDFSYKMVLDAPNYLTVQVADTKHIMLNPEWLQYINHGCDPNVFFNTATFQLEALREVAVGDELCFFYPSTEWLMESPFKCCCGTKACISNIAGASKLSSEEVARYRLTEFITQKLSSNSPAASP